MTKKALSLLLATALGVSGLYAVPAKPGLRTITQPDGTTVQAELRGDEYFSFYVDAQGNPMLRAGDGFLRYAVATADGEMSFRATPAADANEATFRVLSNRANEARTEMNAIPQSVLSQAMKQSISRAQGQDLPQNGMGLMNRQNFPTTGVVKSPVVLVEYTDVNFTVPNPGQFYTNMLNQEGFSQYSAAGSARDFFVENSMGQFLPDFDVFGPVKLKHNRAYYGAPNGSAHDSRAYEMAIEGIAYIASQTDVSKYDMDGDGYIDNLYVIYAGQGQASYGDENTVWPHSSTIYNGPVYNGVRLGRYACSNEWESNRPDGIGTFVHEFSHVMGLPDLYETTYSTGAITPGDWSTMDSGPYNGNGCVPPYYTAYERNALGWMKPILLGHHDVTSIVLPPISQNEAYILQTPTETEFFLLENRQKSGWDKYVPGHGMLVWHINFDQDVYSSNRVNNDPKHQYVDIVKRGSGPSNYTYGASILGRRLIPTQNKLKPWAGPVLPISLTEIYEVDGNITFDVNGGLFTDEAPVANEATNKSAEGFTANWSPVSDATNYLLTVYAKKQTTLEDVAIDFGTSATKNVELPEGWEFSGADNDLYSVASFAGEAIPALKFNGDGVTLTSPMYAGQISNLSFWMRTSFAEGIGFFAIEGRASESQDWKHLDAVANLKAYKVKGENFTCDLTDFNVNQIRFVFYTESTTLKISLDDIAISFAPGYKEYLVGYENFDAADANSHDIALSPNPTPLYTYYVQAKDANGRLTPMSNEMDVDLSPWIAGVENVTIENNFNLAVNGLSLTYTGTPGATVNVYNAAGVQVDAAVADATGFASLSLPSAGLYIVSTPEGSRKLIAK